MEHMSAEAKRKPRLYLEIAAEYAPYDQMREFEEGSTAYLEGEYEGPYQGVQAQAWDRGMEAAMRYTRQFR
jgi:hypothetical protein